MKNLVNFINQQLNALNAVLGISKVETERYRYQDYSSHGFFFSRG